MKVEFSDQADDQAGRIDSIVQLWGTTPRDLRRFLIDWSGRYGSEQQRMPTWRFGEAASPRRTEYGVWQLSSGLELW